MADTNCNFCSAMGNIANFGNIRERECRYPIPPASIISHHSKTAADSRVGRILASILMILYGGWMVAPAHYFSRLVRWGLVFEVQTIALQNRRGRMRGIGII